MKVYVAYCNDRHVDPVIEVFASADDAMKFATQFMRDTAPSPELVKVRHVHGYVLWLYYGGGDDYAYVVERTVN